MTQVPAVDGWFTTGDEPALLASRGKETGSYFFPKNLAFSRNPAAPTEELEEVELSRRGRVWSWATNHYQPPAPYVAADPFVPYTVLAVGDRNTLQARFGDSVSGIAWASLVNSFGFEFSMANADSLQLPGSLTPSLRSAEQAPEGPDKEVGQ